MNLPDIIRLDGTWYPLVKSDTPRAEYYVPVSELVEAITLDKSEMPRLTPARTREAPVLRIPYNDGKMGMYKAVSMTNPIPASSVSDGYHTFHEIYQHRIQLYITLCRALHILNSVLAKIHQKTIWKSTHHSDGEPCFGGGWFVLGIGTQKGNQITYHLKSEYWDQCSFAQTLNTAPDYDGHSSEDVLERLKQLF